MRFVFADFVDKRVEERHEPLIFFFGMWDMSDNVHVSVFEDKFIRTRARWLLTARKEWVGGSGPTARCYIRWRRLITR